jgi:competence protein ComEC
VLRVAYPDGRSIFFGADLDHAGFRDLMADDDIDLAADVLVYPHHGGLVGAGNSAGEQKFANALAKAVRPKVVVFSNGRGQYDNPRPEVVRGVREACESPKIRVVCTQLSKSCSEMAIASDDRLDPTVSSAGASAGLSCSGSLRIDLTGAEPLLPLGHKHMDFVINRVGETALCLSDQLADAPKGV